MEFACTRESCGNALATLGAANPNIAVLTADLAGSTKADDFGKRFPERFFNMGVAEANMINTAAGLAASGKIPFACTFAVFAAGRAWEQIRNTVCYANLNVKIVATHSGLSVGPDGASHQAIADIGLMRILPNMTVLVPCDATESYKAVVAASEHKGPVYLRLCRAKMPVITTQLDKFVIGKANVVKDGSAVAIIACGPMVYPAMLASEALAKENISAAVINLHTVKPMDAETVTKYAAKTGAVVTAEEHLIAGGMGSAVAELLARTKPVPMEMVGVKDRFGQSGDPAELLKDYQLTTEDIVNAARKALSRK
ncbi:MAG: transketolase family protein [Candidatus Brocadiia bacterium]